MTTASTDTKTREERLQDRSPKPPTPQENLHRMLGESGEVPPAVKRWRCPDPSCGFEQVGPVGSRSHRAWESHVIRHDHARRALEEQRAAMARASVA